VETASDVRGELRRQIEQHEIQSKAARA
jgi:hypothetical protein